MITEVKEYPAAAGSGDPPAVGHTEDVEMHDSGDDDDEEEDKQEVPPPPRQLTIIHTPAQFCSR